MIASGNSRLYCTFMKLHCNVKVIHTVWFNVLLMPCYGVVSHCPCDSYSKFPCLPCCAVHRQITDSQISVLTCVSTQIKSTVLLLCVCVCACVFLVVQAFPHGVLQPLPKRQALEKSNGASSLFNPSVLHYQQALANAQLQQPAFFPTGKSSRSIHTAHTRTHRYAEHAGIHTQTQVHSLNVLA